jgi:arylsulfatase A-like enzyme
MDKLDELKLSDKTIVIFSSDNGGVGGYEREGIARDTTDNAPLRMGKGSLYEGGIRVPFIVRWPGVTPAGTVCDQPATHVDLLPTVLEIAGAEAPHDYPLDGESLVPLFRNPRAAWQREAVYQHFPGYLGGSAGKWRTTPASAIITRSWKLIEFFEDGHCELYDLENDVGESNNLFDAMPERGQALRAQLHAWREAIGAPLPRPITDADRQP